jgi:hypothetical protein
MAWGLVGYFIELYLKIILYSGRIDLSITMLRGLLSWGQEGAGKVVRGFCRVGLSLRSISKELYPHLIPSIIIQEI